MTDLQNHCGRIKTGQLKKLLDYRQPDQRDATAVVVAVVVGAAVVLQLE